MNNKFINLIADAVYLEKQLGHMSPFAVNFNKEIAKKFPDSERTGQCASFLAGNIACVGAHHVPEGQSDKKLRYSKNGHNKLLFLLEYEDRSSTAPKNTEEKKKFEGDSVYRGGVRLSDGPIITTSGFHPVLDEALSLTIGLLCADIAYGIQTNSLREKWIKDHSFEFQNPYLLAFCSLVNYVPTVNYDEALEWGLKEIGENFI